MQIDPFSNNQLPSYSSTLTRVQVKKIFVHTHSQILQTNKEMKNMYLYHGYSVTIPFIPHETRLSSMTNLNKTERVLSLS